MLMLMMLMLMSETHIGNSGGGSAFGSSAAVAGLVSALACFSSVCSVFKV